MSEDPREERIAEILGAWYAGRDAEAPLDPEDLIRANPDIERELRDHFQLMDAVGSVLAGPDGETSAAIPERIGPFQVLEELGGGGMGTVLLAETREPVGPLPAKHRVALKVMHPHLFRSPGFYRRFQREGELGLRVRHPNLVRTLAVGSCEEGGQRYHYLAMEHVEGQTLRQLLATPGTVPESLCRRIGEEACRGLAALHAAGAVHRDIKPENIILTPDHVVKVMDLGVARVSTSRATLAPTGAFLGSVAYAAPEQFGSDPADGRADLYALGLVLYELATSVHPFAADDVATVLRRQLQEVPRRPREINAKLTPFFDEVIHALTAKDRGQRPASALEAAELLAAGEDGPWWRGRLERRDAASRVRLPVSRPTRLHGRDDALGRLRDLWRDAQQSRGQAILLEGEAGIGKTRLIDEFLSEAQDLTDARVLHGAYEPYAASTLLNAYRMAFGRHFGDENLAGVLSAYLTEAKRLLPGVAALLSGSAVPEGEEGVDDQRLATALVEILAALGRERPTILVVEDLHYASPAAHRLFNALGRAMREQRVLLIGSHRGGIPGAWADSIRATPHLHLLALARLGPSDLARLLEELFASGGMAEELTYQIALKSDGNPLFVLEIVQALEDEGYIQRRPGGEWSTSSVDHTFRLPEKLADLLHRRFQGLSRLEHEILQVAACIGHEFTADVVADVLSLGRLECLRHLAALERERHVIRSSGRSFAFDHPQMREVLYERMPLPLREGYHGAIARALLQSIPGGDGAPARVPLSLCAKLALHLLNSDLPVRGVPFLEHAVSSRGTVPDLPMHLIQRALGLTGLSDAARSALSLRQAYLHQRNGDWAACEATLNDAIEGARMSGDASLEGQALSNLAALAYDQGRYDVASRHYDRISAIAESMDAGGLRVIVEIGRGNLASAQGRTHEALRHFEHACACAEREPTPRHLRMVARNGMGICCSRLGDLPRARALFLDKLATARSAADPEEIVVASLNVGWMELEEGAFDSAARCFREALGVSREIGDRLRSALALANLAALLRTAGRLDEALSRLDHGLSIWRDLGAAPKVRSSQLTRCDYLSQLGADVEAWRDLEAFFSGAEHRADRRTEALAHACGASVLLRRGHFADAEGHLRRAMALYEEFKEVPSLADCRLLLVHISLCRGDHDAARAQLHAAAEACKAHQSPARTLELQSLQAVMSEVDPQEVSATLEALGDRVDLEVRMRVHMSLYGITAALPHLAEAKRLLDYLVEHAPEQYRESMQTNVRLHREILEAWAQHGAKAGGERTAN